MSTPKPESPFKWRYAMAASGAGGIAGVFLLLLGSMSTAPWGGYVLIGGIGAIFAFLMYLGRNNELARSPNNEYEKFIGNGADYAAGNASTTLGLMGLAEQLSDDVLDASRRDDL